MKSLEEEIHRNHMTLDDMFGLSCTVKLFLIFIRKKLLSESCMVPCGRNLTYKTTVFRSNDEEAGSYTEISF